MATPPTAPDIYSSAFFELELDGAQAVTNLRSIEGGGVKADVINYQMGDNGAMWRQLGKPKYDDIKVSFGLAGSPEFWTWMNRFMTGNHERRNGSIVAGDFNYQAKAKRHFWEALISEIAFPKWDGTDKNSANVTVTISPEKVTYEAASGSIDSRAPAEAKQRNIAACNFDFELHGYKEACARITKVDGFSLKMKVIEHPFGTQLHAAKVPGKMEYPNLVFYLPEVDAQPFRDYHTNAIMNGQRSGGITGILNFYNNAKYLQGSFEFAGVHIFNVSTEKSDSNSEDAKLTKVECAIEGLTVTMNVQDAGHTA
jgi:phage tail-like protein